MGASDAVSAASVRNCNLSPGVAAPESKVEPIGGAYVGGNLCLPFFRAIDLSPFKDWKGDCEHDMKF